MKAQNDVSHVIVRVHYLQVAERLRVATFFQKLLEIIRP